MAHLARQYVGTDADGRVGRREGSDDVGRGADRGQRVAQFVARHGEKLVACVQRRVQLRRSAFHPIFKLGVKPDEAIFCDLQRGAFQQFPRAFTPCKGKLVLATHINDVRCAAVIQAIGAQANQSMLPEGGVDPALILHEVFPARPFHPRGVELVPGDPQTRFACSKAGLEKRDQRFGQIGFGRVALAKMRAPRYRTDNLDSGLAAQVLHDDLPLKRTERALAAIIRCFADAAVAHMLQCPAPHRNRLPPVTPRRTRRPPPSPFCRYGPGVRCCRQRGLPY